MKRLKILIFIVFIGLWLTPLKAQAYMFFQSGTMQNFEEDSYPDFMRYEIKELKDLEFKIDQFSFALRNGNISKAARIKQRIINDMVREVNQTREKTDMAKRELRSSKQDAPFYRKYTYQKNGGVYSEHEYSYHKYVDRMESQKSIINQLEHLDLDFTEDFRRNGMEHIQLMQRFISTMHSDLMQTKNEYLLQNRQR